MYKISMLTSADLRPSAETRTLISALLKDAKILHAKSAQVLAAYGITTETRFEGIISAPPELDSAFRKLFTKLDNLPEAERTFVDCALRLGDIKYLAAQAPCFSLYPAKLEEAMDALKHMDNEDEQGLCARHFYLAAKKFSDMGIRNCLGDEEFGVREEVEAMGLIFNPLTHGDLAALSDSRLRLKGIFALLTHDQKLTMTSTIRGDAPCKTIDELMALASGNDPRTIATASSHIFSASKAQWPDYRGASFLIFN